MNSLQVIIVGAGPIGIELAITLERLGVAYVLLEGQQVGAAFMKWPPATRFYSTPEHVALAGVPVHNRDQHPITGEEYLAYLRMLVEMYDLNLRNYEPVRRVVRQAGGFVVETETRTGWQQYEAPYVVVATGGMARPRMLGIPGEDLPHVSHYFEGPHKYFRTKLLVVGGKNSALESALRCWRGGAEVAISYRRPAFDFEVVKPHLAMDMKDRLEKGEITFYPATLPVEITPTHVVLAATEDGLNANGQTVRVAADFVLLNTGFEADMSLLEAAGVTLGERPERAPLYNPETMETNVPGLYVAGTAAGGTQQRFTYFISTCHEHVAKIVRAITGREVEQLGTAKPRRSRVTWEEVKQN